MNYNLYSGGLSDHLTFETLGAATIPFGVGHSERLLTMMAGLTRPGRHLGDAVVRDPPRRCGAQRWGSSRARSACVAATSPARRGSRCRATATGIEATWGMVARDQYGTGELGLHSGECDERNGVHWGGTGIAIAELIDPDAGDVLPFEDGQRGEVVYTSIHREASPLLRMRSHDLMEVFTDPCPCGRTTFRFRILGSLGRHVHRQGRQRLPTGDPGDAARSRAARDRRVPGRHRPPAAHRLPGAAQRRGVARRPGRGARGAGARGRRSAPGGPQLHGGRAPRPARHHRDRGQDPSRHPQLSRGGPLVAVVDVETRGDVAIIALDRPEKLNAINDEMLDGPARRDRDRRSRRTRSGRRCWPVAAGRSRPAATSRRWTAMDESTFDETIARYMRVSDRLPRLPEADRRGGPRLRARGWLRTGPDLRRPLCRGGDAVRAPGHAPGPQPDERDDLAAAARDRTGSGHVPDAVGSGHRRRGSGTDRPRQPRGRT